MERKLNISESSVIADSFAIPRHSILEIKVDTKAGFPDLAVVLMEQLGTADSHLRSHARLEIRHTTTRLPIFAGEIYAVDRLYSGGKKVRMLVRAANKAFTRR